MQVFRLKNFLSIIICLQLILPYKSYVYATVIASRVVAALSVHHRVVYTYISYKQYLMIIIIIVIIMADVNHQQEFECRPTAVTYARVHLLLTLYIFFPARYNMFDVWYCA
jgi:hypothetical protein